MTARVLIPAALVLVAYRVGVSLGRDDAHSLWDAARGLDDSPDAALDMLREVARFPRPIYWP